MTNGVSCECHDCKDVHQLQQRTFNGFTTECPSCDSPSYRSTALGDQRVGGHKRLKSALDRADGVGETVKQRVLSDITAPYEATHERLSAISGIGGQTADNIVQQLQ